VQHVEDDDGVDGGEGGRSHVATDDVDAVAERLPGALDVALEHVDAADANVDRRLGPVARPASLACGLRRRREQAGEEPLTATDVEDRVRGAIRPRARRWLKTGSQRSLPRAKCQANLPAR
jgi:hypothetical protein